MLQVLFISFQTHNFYLSGPETDDIPVRIFKTLNWHVI